MFADDFLSMSLEGLLGLMVTAVGIWLVVKQLYEAKLASQMEGLLTLLGQLTDLHDERMALNEMTSTKEW